MKYVSSETCWLDLSDAEKSCAALDASTAGSGKTDGETAEDEAGESENEIGRQESAICAKLCGQG